MRPCSSLQSHIQSSTLSTMNMFLSTYFQTEQLSKIHSEHSEKGDLRLFAFKTTCQTTARMQITCKGGLTYPIKPSPGSRKLVSQRPHGVSGGLWELLSMPPLGTNTTPIF